MKMWFLASLEKAEKKVALGLFSHVTVIFRLSFSDITTTRPLLPLWGQVASLVALSRLSSFLSLYMSCFSHLCSCLAAWKFEFEIAGLLTAIWVMSDSLFPICQIDIPTSLNDSFSDTFPRVLITQNFLLWYTPIGGQCFFSNVMLWTGYVLQVESGQYTGLWDSNLLWKTLYCKWCILNAFVTVIAATTFPAT